LFDRLLYGLSWCIVNQLYSAGQIVMKRILPGPAKLLRRRAIACALVVGISLPAAAQGQTSQAKPITTAAICGRATPIEIMNPHDFSATDEGSISHFQGNEIKAYVKGLNDVCAASRRYRLLFAKKVAAISVANAQGATEPNAYLNGRKLVIEFVGGKFDQKPFEKALRDALLGKPPPMND
jgi:hypothetical protein